VNPETVSATEQGEPPPPPRRKASLIPLGILALMLVVGLVTLWRSCAGRSLNDDELAKALRTDAGDLDTLTAAENLSRRIESKDADHERYYPAVIELAKSPDPEKRKVMAWLMGFDPDDGNFKEALKVLVTDPLPIVRFNAGPALALHRSSAARPVLLEMLQPSTVPAPADGVFHPKAKVGEIASWHHVIGVIASSSGEVTVEPATPGRIRTLAADGATVTKGSQIASLAPSQDAAKHALVALTMPAIARPGDADLIEAFLKANPDLDEDVRNQAREAILAAKGAK
jgi:hypothetical protein